MFSFKKEFLVVYLLLGIVLALAGLRVFAPGIDPLSFIVPYRAPASSDQQAQAQSEETITVSVDFGDGQKKTVEDISAANALAALQQIAVKENLDLQLKEYDFGTLVQKIDTYENTQEKAWIYYVNGQGGDVAAEQKELKSGDVVEWRYVTPE